MRIAAGTAANQFMIMRFVIPYFVILILSLVVGIVIYQRTSTVLEDEVKVSNQVLLEQGMNVLDKRWEDVDTFIRRIASDSKVTRLQQIADPYGSTNLYRLIEAQERLQEYYNANDFVTGYYILYKNNGMVVNNDFISRLRDFPDYVRYVGEKEDYVASFLTTYQYRHVLPATEVALKGGSSSIITYLQSFGLSSYSNATVMVLVDNREITGLFEGLNISGGWAYIADDKGNIITSVTGRSADLPLQRLDLPDKNGVMTKKIGSKDMMITYVTSGYNGWTYVAAQPSNVVLTKILYIKKTTFTIFFAFLFVGAAFAVYVAYRDSKPVRAMVQTLAKYSPEPSHPNRNAFRMINNAISSIIESNRELKTKMELQLPFLRASFFERLLRGQFRSGGEIEAVMQHVRVELDGGTYAVAVLTFPVNVQEFSSSEIELLNQKKIMIRELISSLIPRDVYLHDVEEDKIAMLFAPASRDGWEAEVGLHLQNIQRHIYRELGMTTLISIGNAYTERMDISRSFTEAQQALVKNDDNRIIWFKDMKRNNSSNYYYPENMELRFINLVRSGDEEALQQLIGELHRQNFAERQLPVLVLNVFLFDFLGSVLKISEYVGSEIGFEAVTDVNPHPETVASIERHFTYLGDTLIAICRAVSAERNAKTTIWFQNILQFIDEHYADLQLSLSLLADRFNVTEPYLSRCFKERTGINFFDYLEGRRIEKSKELLLGTGKPVGEIALLVGYGSANTFSRAFKRTVGLSAMAFRETMMSKSKN